MGWMAGWDVWAVCNKIGRMGKFLKFIIGNNLVQLFDYK
jgi:hypothetical protein